MDNDSCIIETVVHLYRYSSDNHLISGVGITELQYFGKIQIQKWPALFQNLQSFVSCSMERSIRYNFFIDVESIQHRLSSDYSLNLCFSHRFLHIDGPSFSPCKLLQNVYF